jgi:hypothetical protein
VSEPDDRSASSRRSRRSSLAFAGLLLSVGVAASCQHDADTALPSSTSSTPAGTVPESLTPAGGSVATDFGVDCTHTDPGATPISVSRALTCPDGTRVWVRAVMLTQADGIRWICDDPAASASECADKGLQVIGGDGPIGIQLIGVKWGRTLRIQDELATRTLVTEPQ